MWSFSKIFNPVRNFVAKIPIIKYPLICPECSSFWIGLFVSLFLYTPFLIVTNLYINSIILGLITHLFASFIYKKLL
jgi:hypothetical protein